MPRLYMKEDGSFIGTLSESDLKFLIDQLEEEDESDDDYFIDGSTIDLLTENGASEALTSMLCCRRQRRRGDLVEEVKVTNIEPTQCWLTVPLCDLAGAAAVSGRLAWATSILHSSSSQSSARWFPAFSVSFGQRRFALS